MTSEERTELRAEISRLARIRDVEREIDGREWKLQQRIPTDLDRLAALREERVALHAIAPIPGRCAAIVAPSRLRCIHDAKVGGYCHRHAPVYGAAPETRGRRWTRASVLAAIRDYAARNGRPPTSHEWKRGGDHPSFNTVRRLFGSFASAIEAAGYPRPTRGRRLSIR